MLLVQSCASTFVSLTTRPPVHGMTDRQACARWEKRTPGVTAWVDSLRREGILKDTMMTVNGLRLRAFFAPAEQASGKTAVIVHGFFVNPMAVMMLARMYRDDFGYNVWLPEQRRHGKSEGQAVQFGWAEKFDVLEWSRIAHWHFNDSLQVFHGVSYGAASVMMASGEPTPDYVKGFIEDCGYSCVWDEFTHVRKKYLLSGNGKALAKSEQINKDLYGWSYHEASSLDQLAKCSKPMLFIHGGDDPLVPTAMAWDCYEAKTDGYRKIWIAPGSGHAWSFPDHTEEYTDEVRAFLSEQVERR